jgi:predicted secreted hydrolase
MKSAVLALSAILAAICPALVDAQPSQPPSTTTSASQNSTHPFAFEFPRDLYDHPSYQTEWWYFTGNLESLRGKDYGFELTFFHSYEPTGAPAGQPQYVPVIFADLAVSDINGQKFFFHKNLAPATSDYAGITEKPWTIHLGEWKLTEPDSTSGVFRLKAEQDGFGVDLALVPEGPPVLHGANGLFELAGSDGQGPEYFEYYSIPRVQAGGTIRVAGEVIPVRGLAWNDHEFFNLAPNQQLPPWDWFSIQLHDGASIMLYGLRLPNGDYDPDSRGTFVAADGKVTHLFPGDFTLVPGKTWHSAESNANYPISWRISIPSLRVQLEMSTGLRDQELPAVQGGATPAYWEGASHFRGTRDGHSVEGKGYVEMTGYGEP